MTLRPRSAISTTFVLAIFALASGVVRAEPPCWIWAPEPAEADSTIKLSKTFRVAADTNSVRLRFATAYAQLTVLLDGNVIAVAEPYAPLRSIEVDSRLECGDHELLVQAKGVTGPSAFFLQLDLKFDNGNTESILSNSTWRLGSGSPAVSLGKVDRRLLIPDARGIGIDVVDNYEQWKQALAAKRGTDPAKFLLAPNFEIQLIRSAAPDEDSWVSMVFDAQ